MTALARIDRTSAPPMTVAEFSAFLEQKPDPRAYDLVGGFVVMMASLTETHNQIAVNIGAALKPVMDKRKCRTYMSDMRVQRSERIGEIEMMRPDVVVRCGPHHGKTFITDPLIVVEVLSPSTMDIDRGPKLDFYQSLPSMSHIALVYQDQMRVEHYRRTDTGWQRDVLLKAGDELVFDTVSFKIDLAAVYFDLDMAP